MQPALATYILGHIDLLQHTDFLLEIFTECDRLAYGESIITAGVMYEGKLLIKGDKFVSVKAFTQTDLDQYTIDEVEPTDIKVEKGIPLATPTSKLVLPPGIVVNSGSAPIKTTLGRVILNYLILAYPFGTLFPYHNGVWTPNIEGPIFDAAMDEKITAAQINTYVKNLYFIGHKTELSVPNYTEKSLTTDPAVAKRRKELLEEHKDALLAGDATVMSAIESELIAMDKEWLKGDPSMDFYGKDLRKAFEIQRKKMLVIGGMSEKFGESGQFNFIDAPLADGVSQKNFAPMVNEIRRASWSRAMETVDGGVVAKTLVRSLQNAVILEEDCQTKVTMPITLRASSADLYRDRYIIDKGKLVQLTASELSHRIGQTVGLRSPMGCKTKGGYCQTCMGKLFKTLDQESITLRGLSFSAWVLTNSLKKSHGEAYSTVDVSDLNRFTF